MSAGPLAVATAAAVLVGGRHEGAAALVVWPSDDPLAGPVRSLLEGHPARAVAALTDLVDTRTDEVTMARAAAWGGLAASLRANCSPGGTFGSGLDVTRRWTRLWAHPPAPPSTPDAVALERDLVGSLLPGLPLARSTIGPGPVPRDPADALDRALTDVARIEGVAPDEPTVVGFCLRTRADLLRRAGRRGDATAALAAARTAAAGDDVELAACELLAGDLALAPWTHPDAADLLLVDGGLESSALPWAVESVEGDPARVDMAAATAAYDRAEAAYARAWTDATTPTAVLRLRRAGLARVAGDHAAAVGLAEEAAAFADRGGDAWVAHTARVHAVLARVAAGVSLGDGEAPELVGRWGATTGSYAYAAGLARLLSRAGRWWLVRGGDPDRAGACHRLAQRLTAALDAPLARDQNLVDEAATLAAVGADDAALLRYEAALDDLGPRLGSAGDADTWRRTVSLGLRVHAVRLRGDDPGALRRSAARLVGIAGHAPDGTDGQMDASLRVSAAESAASAEVHAILAEGDQARDRGDRAVRDERYAAALAAAEAVGDDLAVAVTLARLGRTGEASAAYRRHEDVVRRQRTAALAALRAELGDDLPADLESAFTGTGEAHARAAAFLARIGAHDDAAAAFDELEATSPRWWEAEDRPWELLSTHGHVREARHELARAAQLHELGTTALDQRGLRVARDELKTALNAGSGEVFGRAARTQLRLAEASGEALGDHAATAFRLAEEGRARALAELLSTTRPVPGGAAPTAAADDAVRAWSTASGRVALTEQLLATERAAPATDPDRLAALHDELVAAGAALEAATDRLRTAAPELAHAVARPAPVTVEEVAGLVPDGAVLVSHLVVDDDLLVWAIGPGGLLAAARRSVDARGLRRDLGDLAGRCARGEPWSDVARAVAEVLLTPVGGVLGGATRLYLVPTGIGHATPLHLLPWGDGLLTDLAPIAVLPTVAALRHLSAPTTPPPAPTLVVGDPEGARTRGPGGEERAASPLPGARLEADAVARLVGDDPPLTGGAATADAVWQRLPSARYVHVAAHAVVEPTAPLTSAILLADGGRLQVADLVGHRLAADLVVLSACDSGRGPTTGGDEVLGLTRALLAAGAGAAVVTLWPVDDVSTALVMTRFVTGLEGGSDPAAALREAQRWYRGLDEAGRSAALAALGDVADDGGTRALVRSTVPAVAPAHPLRWGGFVYVGAHPRT